MPASLVTVPVRCACGAVHGSVDVSPGRRVLCYCRDCQAYARFLGSAGIVDERGGSDVCPTWPSRLRLDGGLEQLAGVRLSPKGLTRWYTRCCRTPIGNTFASARSPFVGVLQPFMDHRGTTRDAQLGPVVTQSWGEHATPPLPREPLGRTLRGIARALGLVGRGVLAGGHRPSVFFDDRGVLRVTPEVLTPEARAALSR